jgi:acetylornithine/succinyldiaminopimelate/putrescine aminotransferase
MAKGLGGGLPVGACVTNADNAEVLQPGDHGSTFAGGPVAAAAANAALDVLEDPALHARVRELGERLREGLAELPRVASVRGRGLMVAFEVDGGGAPDLVRELLLEHRMVANATGPETIRLLPPLIVGEHEIDDALARLRALLGG